ncbi:hypothetical protein CO614_02685 [Lysobacteraceae bacterium NML120232]|nr:hypothetical protein CO608_05695 [Xanthomonadaceae bacterium NML08-0793]PJK12969.1 hypothetical protein CO614_02685 [Xanthomonadaceae bacterium NML120232]
MKTSLTAVDLSHIDRNTCSEAINDLLLNCDGVTAVMLALRDGHSFMERSQTQLDGGKLAAITSSLHALGATALRELRAGVLDHVLVTGSGGKLLIASIPNSDGMLILSVLSSNDARLGMVLGRTMAAAQKIGSSF